MALGGSNSRTFWVYPQGRCSLEEQRLLGGNYSPWIPEDSGSSPRPMSNTKDRGATQSLVQCPAWIWTVHSAP